jgi:hypothetical protein
MSMLALPAVPARSSAAIGSETVLMMQDNQQDRPALSAHAETPRAKCRKLPICGDKEGPILVLYSGVGAEVSLQVKKEISVMRAVVGL